MEKDKLQRMVDSLPQEVNVDTLIEKLYLLDKLEAAEIGLGRHQVGVWRRRWQQVWERLTIVECCETPADFRAAVIEVLSDEPRPGAPPTFTPEQITDILAVACEPPEDSGRPVTHWTPTELADEVIKRGLRGHLSRALPSGLQTALRRGKLGGGGNAGCSIRLSSYESQISNLRSKI